MKVAITGFGLSVAGYDDENSFWRNYYSDASEFVFDNLECTSKIDYELDKYLYSSLKNELKINSFKPIKNIYRADISNNFSLHVLKAADEAIKKSNLSKILRKTKAGACLNTMYPIYGFGNRKHPVQIKSQLEQQVPSYLSSVFPIHGPVFVSRGSENADLVSTGFLSNQLTPEVPIFFILGLNVINPTFLRIEAFHKLKKLKGLNKADPEYFFPTKFTEIATCIVVESYSHAIERNAQIYGTINNSVHEKYSIDLSNLSLMKDSLQNVISKNKIISQNPMIFSGFDQNYLQDTIEYEVLEQYFKHSRIVNSTKRIGACPAAMGLFNIIQCLKYFEGGNTLNKISADGNRFSTNRGVFANDVKEVLVHSFSRAGYYAGVSLSKN